MTHWVLIADAATAIALWAWWRWYLRRPPAQYLIWREGEALSARVVRGWFAMQWHKLRLSPGRVWVVPVNKLTLAGAEPRALAEQWEHWLRIVKGMGAE